MGSFFFATGLCFLALVFLALVFFAADFFFVVTFFCIQSSFVLLILHSNN